LDAIETKDATAGATRYVNPIDKPWGQTVAYVRDANGILIELATPVS
jgi:lactoylglutathione lyase